MHGADRRGVTFVIPDGENVIVRLRMRLNARIPRRAAAPAERFVIGVHRLARLRHAHFVNQNVARKVVIKHHVRRRRSVLAGLQIKAESDQEGSKFHATSLGSRFGHVKAGG